MVGKPEAGWGGSPKFGWALIPPESAAVPPWKVTFPIYSYLKDEWQMGPEIHLLAATPAIKFNFEQRRLSKSSL
jgi:hypothetical protein